MEEVIKKTKGRKVEMTKGKKDEGTKGQKVEKSGYAVGLAWSGCFLLRRFDKDLILGG